MAFFILFSAGICQAEEEKIGFSVSQSIFNFDLDPGEELTFPIDVQSLRDESQRMSVEISDFVVKAQNETELLNGENEKNGMRDWLTSSENVWIFEGKENKELGITIKVPKNAAMGSHYTAIALKALPTVDIENFQKPIVGGRILVYTFVNVKGAIDGSGEISRFDIPQLVSGEAGIEVDFKNIGNVHYIPHGELEVENLISGVAKKERMESHFIFPGQSYTFKKNWKVASPFGIYVARASFVDGNQSEISQRKIILGRFFFVIPLVFAILIFVLVKWIMAGRKNKKSAENDLDKGKNDSNEIEKS